jgi:hypothetical protein
MRFLLPIPPNVLPLYRSKMQGSSAWMTLSSAPTPLNLKAILAKSPPSNWPLSSAPFTSVIWASMTILP